MEFKIRRKLARNMNSYRKEDLDLAYKYAKYLYKEMGDFIKAIILHSTKKESLPQLKILVIVDDVSFEISSEMIESYRIISEKIIDKISSSFVVKTMKLSSFWEYVKVGDPLMVNLLREGVSLIDTGFFEPVQHLLALGKIRPTDESVWTYFYRSPQTMQNAKYHVLAAMIDLYWASSNISHAALMKLEIIPPSPEHLADFVKNHLAVKGIVTQKQADLVASLYHISRMILHKKMNAMDGANYDVYRKATIDYVETVRKFVEKNHG